MDYEDEVNVLSAETLAIQTVIAHVFDHLFAIGDPQISAAIQRGFSEAASDVENLALQSIKSPDPKRFVKALSIIEELRTATLGDHEKPKRGI